MELGDRCPQYLLPSRLFWLSYVFLLRVPSEALPLVIQDQPDESNSLQSRLECKAGELILPLRERKNRPQGAVLGAKCWCAQDRALCPIHGLMPYFIQKPSGSVVFHGVTQNRATQHLRDMLAQLEVPRAREYRLHDFRRGHARDLQKSDANAVVLWKAGQWSSKSFTQYLEEAEVEAAAVHAAHGGEQPRSCKERVPGMLSPGAAKGS